MALTGFTFRPGVGDAGSGFDGVYISQDGSHNVIHVSGPGSDNMTAENLGGWADERAGVGCTWSPDGAGFFVYAVGDDGFLWRNYWNKSGWTGWGHITTTGTTAISPLLPSKATAGPQGPAGPAGADGKDGAPGVGFTPQLVADLGAVAASLAQTAKDLPASTSGEWWQRETADLSDDDLLDGAICGTPPGMGPG